METPTLPTLFPARLLVFLFTMAAAPALADPPPAPAVTLAQAAGEAATHNQALLIEKLEARRAELGVPAAEGAFLPNLVLATTLSDAEGPVIAAGHTRRLASKAGVEYQGPYGTSAAVSLTHDWTSAPVAEPVQATDPQQGAGVAIELRQPLLRGAGRDGAAFDVREADVDARLQRELFRDALDRFLAEVDAAYWDLALAQADVVIRTRSRDRARVQAEETIENIRRGLLAPTERYIVDESLNLFEQSLVEAEEARAQTASRLARLLERPAGEPLAAAESLDAGRTESTLDAALAAGLADSPSLRAARLALEQAQVRLAYDEDQTLPSLDLGATLALNGLGPGAGDALADLSPRRNRELAAGLTFSMPLLDDGNEARTGRGRLATQQRIAALSRAEADLRYALADTLRGRAARERGLALSREVVRLAELKLAAEREKYQSGISTLADVVRFQRELDAALITEQRALRTLRDDDTHLLTLQGALHRARGVEVGP